MKLSVFSTKPYDKKYMEVALAERSSNTTPSPPPPPIEITYHLASLTEDTAQLAAGSDAVCVFVNDSLTAAVVDTLHGLGVRAVLLRCAGFNNVDLARAGGCGLVVANVPSYSPEAVAEFAVALVQTLNRKTHRAYNRVREGNFALDGLLGRTLFGKTVGVIGTGRIGLATARIMKGFGCRILAYDPYPSPAFEPYGEYRALEDVLPESDIVSLHCPLTEQTKHIINDTTIAKAKPGFMLVNTSRGGLVDTKAAFRGLKSKQIGSMALDVYEGEGSLFYDDHSGEVIEDDLLMRLMTFHNVIVCGHQAFFTEEALEEIAECTLRNLTEFMESGTCKNSLIKDVKAKQEGPLPVRNV